MWTACFKPDLIQTRPIARRAANGKAQRQASAGRPKISSGDAIIKSTRCCTMCAENSWSSRVSNGEINAMNRVTFPAAPHFDMTRPSQQFLVPGGLGATISEQPSSRWALGFAVLGNSSFLVPAPARMVMLGSFVHGIVSELQIKSLLAACETGQNSLLGIGLPFSFDLMRANALPHCTIRTWFARSDGKEARA